MHIKTCKEHKNEFKYDEISSMFATKSMMICLPKRKKGKTSKAYSFNKGGKLDLGYCKHQIL
jgi:hypothetical protein